MYMYLCMRFDPLLQKLGRELRRFYHSTGDIKTNHTEYNPQAMRKIHVALLGASLASTCTWIYMYMKEPIYKPILKQV